MTLVPSFRCLHEVLQVPLDVNTPVSRQPDPLGLDQDLVLEEVGGGEDPQGGVHRVGPEEVAQHAGEQLGHPVLLLLRAVVLDRQDEGVGGGGEGVGLDGVGEDVLEEEFGGESPAVVDDRFSVASVPAVQL